MLELKQLYPKKMIAIYWALVYNTICLKEKQLFNIRTGLYPGQKTAS